MAVSFTGQVSAQIAESTITIMVSKLDADGNVENEDTITTQTDTDGNFTASKKYLPGSYKAKAHVDVDSRYKAKDSEEKTFAVELEDRSITLNVSVV